MEATTERRYNILIVLSKRRYDTLDNLAIEFCVSKKSIWRDIQVLQCIAPITPKPGRYGGISITDKDFYFGKQYLTPQQENLLRDILPSLSDEEQAIMQSIISSFSLIASCYLLSPPLNMKRETLSSQP